MNLKNKKKNDSDMLGMKEGGGRVYEQDKKL